MTAITICGDLEFQSLKADAIVGADRPLILFTEDVVDFQIKWASFP
jgi:hypothetical protein